MERIALMGENSIEYISLLIDIWNNGDCAVLLNWRIPVLSAIEMMKEAEVHKCYIEKKLLDKISFSLPAEIEFITFTREHSCPAYLPKYVYDKFSENYSRDEAVIIYSSGTTGESKGIVLSHYAIHTNADAIIAYMKPDTDDCIYIAKDLTHSSTLTGELLVSLKTNNKLVIAPTIVPPRYIFYNIMKFNVTIMCLNPTLLEILAESYKQGDYEIESLKTIYVSGSVLNDKVYNIAHKVFCNIEIYNVYGLSEAGPRVAAQRTECCKGNSVGKAINGVEIVVVDERGIVVNNGENGIIHIKTPSLYDCYVTGKEKHLSLYKDWYNTGDIGYFDKNNELHIVDRIDDVIILESHKIYPDEIEKQIINNTDVSECVVTKVEFKNNEVIACLFVGEECESNIREKIKKYLSVYEIPRCFLKSKMIPKTLNGKVQKKEIKELISQVLEAGE